jgi:hypothetical protein
MIAIVPHDMASALLMIGRKGSQFIYPPLESTKLRIQLRVLFFQTYCLLNCSGFSSLPQTRVPCRELILVMVQPVFLYTHADKDQPRGESLQPLECINVSLDTDT